jgi:hypothetical protein
VLAAEPLDWTGGGIAAGLQRHLSVDDGKPGLRSLLPS